jgi:CRISPR-associated endonuclease/helicase Cas3
MMGRIADYLCFWGKAQPLPGGGAPAWHPAAYHCLDVAAACERLLDLDPAFARAFAEAALTDEVAARNFIIRLAALHDIGKFSIGFQAKVPSLYPQLLGAIAERPPLGDHTAIGHRMLAGALRSELTALAPSLDDFAWRPLLCAVAGHHGRPIGEAQILDSDIGTAAIAAARAFMADAMPALGPKPFSGQLDDVAAKQLSWRLAGLVNLADWIGSNQREFAYQAPDRDAATYLAQVARPRAATALATAGLAPPAVASVTGFQALTARNDIPSPLQAFAETVELPRTGPMLALIEDVTGAGKTEAALILAHRLMQLGHGEGLFMALPTMATANAMYDRLGDLYRRLFVPGSDPSLVLAHGARELHPGFRSAILEVGREQTFPPGVRDDEIPASAACAAWIADDRRKAFFADVGVGTIDQAFLAVLPAKFAALRLYGLSGRVLVVDEAHAYDAYESEELVRLIQFHAAQGGSSIVLSATLPEVAKDRLVKAFRAALGRRGKSQRWPSDYPLVSIAGSDGTLSLTPLATRPDLPRSVGVRRLPEAAAALDAVEQAARAGAAVAYLRNTVDDALSAHSELRARGLEPMLYHARFAMFDRLRIEAEVVRTFGKGSSLDHRSGKILVSTQVVEQSLDIDFDLFATDLAPIDLLIQRAGRLWRHQRQDRPLRLPEFLVVSPEPVADAGAKWYRDIFPKAAYVYANHALLWQTAKILFDTGAIVSPSGVRALVESVYRKGALDGAPKGLEGRRSAAEGRESADKSLAMINLLKLGDGYAPSSAWDSDTRTPTRLGEPRTVLRLARIVDGGLLPWAPIGPGADADAIRAARLALRRAWALSEVSVAAYRANGRGSYAAVVEAAASEIEALWREIGDGAVLLPLNEEAGRWCGRVSVGEGGRRQERKVVYDEAVGLVFSTDED